MTEKNRRREIDVDPLVFSSRLSQMQAWWKDQSFSARQQLRDFIEHTAAREDTDILERALFRLAAIGLDAIRCPDVSVRYEEIKDPIKEQNNGYDETDR